MVVGLNPVTVGQPSPVVIYSLILEKKIYCPILGGQPANFQLLFDNLLLATPFFPLYNVAIIQRLKVNVGDRLFYPSWWFARRAIL
jgi:hypothetical protein